MVEMIEMIENESDQDEPIFGVCIDYCEHQKTPYNVQKHTFRQMTLTLRGEMMSESCNEMCGTVREEIEG